MSTGRARPQREPVRWWQAEPRRLARDEAQIAQRYPDLTYVPEGEGGWVGRLPRWPLDRPEPAELVDLIGESGLAVEVRYPAAYPMITPTIRPIDPAPAIIEWTQQRWHVLGDGSLCLVQTQAAWNPAASITDLLDKAAAWRVEYALLKAGVREDMTLSGIVEDSSCDHLIAEALRRLADGANQADGDARQETR